MVKSVSVKKGSSRRRVRRTVKVKKSDWKGIFERVVYSGLGDNIYVWG